MQSLQSKLKSSPPPAPVCRAFKYFVWLNSSVRGPFLPAYHPAGMHWTAAFVRKLRGDVKLVGSTINCGGAYALSAQQPHIQSYAVAMDQVRHQNSSVWARSLGVADGSACGLKLATACPGVSAALELYAMSAAQHTLKTTAVVSYLCQQQSHSMPIPVQSNAL